MNPAERSLLSFLDAAVIVGDPAGCTVWANPAFLDRFGVEPTELLGRPLAEFFGGGGRERVLGAVAKVCRVGGSDRFRIREQDRDFEAVISAIEAEGECVGVVILLKDALQSVERLVALHRNVEEPLGDLALALDAMLEQTGGRRSERYRSLVEDGLRALERVRKICGEAGAIVMGEGTDLTADSFVPGAPLRRAVEKARRTSRVPVELLAPASLPSVEGDSAVFEDLLTRMAVSRLVQRTAPERLVVAARPVAGAVLVSLTELGGDAARVPEDLAEAHAALPGADVAWRAAVALGRTTVLRLPTAG